ncbi:MAG: TMEM165/GDT1 family protein [Candidatus Woesearchaeota archaeon]|nr:TMEM165/GDT1 family protein [Candidatus Woesearchaeota archaeon]
MLEAFISAVVFSVLGEIADKTQLIILGLSLKYKAPFKVFLGALAGHAVMDGIAIIIGYYFGFVFSSNMSILDEIVGSLFILFGLWGLLKRYIIKSRKEKENKVRHSMPLIATFLTILVVEIGDKTQIASGLLAAKYLQPIPIILGVIVGLAITIGLNVFVGRKLAEKLPRNTIRTASYILFILFGLFTLLF